MSGKRARSLRKAVANYPLGRQRKIYRKLKKLYSKGHLKFKKDV